MNNMVSIVGGGPAGASLATFLSSEESNVTLYEKSPERRKPCGGALTWRVVEKYGKILHLNEVPMYSSKELFLDFEGKVLKVYSTKNLVYVVDRLAFDNHLRNLAQSNGAKIETKNIANPMEINDSLVVDSRGFEPSKKQYSLKVAICKMKEPKMMFVYRKNMISKGYFWVFPIDESHADVGVGGMVGGIRTPLKDAFDWFAKEVGATPEVSMGWGISHSRHFNNLIIDAGDKKIVKVGERAKIVNSVTGEGIYYAIRSSEILSSCILKNDLDSYQRKLKKEFNTEFLLSDIIIGMTPYLPKYVMVQLVKMIAGMILKNVEIKDSNEKIIQGS